MTTPPASARGRLFPQPLVSVTLLAVWLLAHNAVTPGLVALGVAAAVLVPLATRRFWPEYPRTVRYLPLARLALVVLLDIVVANARVARLVLGPRARLRPAFFLVPVALDEPYPVTLLASIISLTPGTVSADLSADGRTLLVHGLDVDDVPATVARIKARYERPLVEVFG
jgi:multicomponent K+:H+ antiporter subunit E